MAAAAPKKEYETSSARFVLRMQLCETIRKLKASGMHTAGARATIDTIVDKAFEDIADEEAGR